MVLQLKELAQLVDGQIIGDADLEISGVGGVSDVQDGEITFAQSDDYLAKAEASLAETVIVSKDISEDIESKKTLLIVDNPRLAFAKIAQEFAPQLYETNEVHPTAVIADDVQLGERVSIGPNVTIGSGSQIADDVRIAAGVYIGEEVVLGAETLIHPNVVINYDTTIGNNVIIQAGAILGSDGYGFESDATGHCKIPQLGNVIIEDEVEIGANVTIDRGATGATIVGKGTKIDNLVHIAHNVRVGENCLLIAQVGIAGSAKIGDWVRLAGQSGVVGHLEVGKNTTLAANSIITNDVPPNSFYSGYPAREHKSEMRIKAARRKLPDMVKELRSLRKEVKELKAQLREEGIDEDR
ncbi:MAG: UDP-3-O-[3-hydroxymyristoyl] glucosamine N-acyltransferase [Candidatus Frackibacter sp. T328-2]|nr:MAG: UDP-3-O-[3-hydroxymyristoyl] glucosamine N-acyltransferase [Candidatus Frackibacter sp. T328-2]